MYNMPIDFWEKTCYNKGDKKKGRYSPMAT